MLKKSKWYGRACVLSLIAALSLAFAGCSGETEETPLESSNSSGGTGNTNTNTGNNSSQSDAAVTYYVGIGADSSIMSLSSVKVNNEEKLSAATTVTTSWTGYKVDEFSDENWTVAFTFKMTEVGTSNWTDFNWEIRNNNDQSYWGGRYDNYMVGWLTGYYSYGAWGDNDADTLSAGAAYGGHWYNVGTNTLAYDHSETLDKTCVLTFQKLAYGIKATLTSEGTEVWSCLNPLYGYEKSLASIELDTSAVQKTFTKGTTFNSTGLKVTAKYDDESTADVSDSENVSVEADLETEGSAKVTVSYTEGDVTKTAEYEIEVTATVSLSSIEIADSVKKTFALGDTFSTEGLAVTAKYSDATEVDVTSSATVDSSAVNTGKPGAYTVSVSYTEDGVTKTATYSIVVQEPLPYAVSDTTAYTTADTATAPLAVTDSTGVSFSFEVTGLTSDWTHIVRTAVTALCLPNMDWWNGTDFVANFWPDTNNGASFSNGGAWNSWSSQATKQYAVISIASDGTVTVYKNGELKLTYAGTATANNSTISALMSSFISEIASSGVYFDGDDSISITNMVIDAAKTADEVASSYKALATATSLSVSGQTSSYQVNDTVTFDGTATLTDSYGSTYTVTPSISEVDTSSAGTKTVTVSYTATDSDLFTGTVSTTYDITVTKEISSIAETSVSGLLDSTIYYNLGALKSALVDSSLVITATFSDNSTEEVDLSLLTFTYSNGKVTATYAGKTVELSETLSCASNEGTYTSANAGNAISLSDGSTIIATFTQNTKGNDNWNTCYPVISNVGIATSETTTVSTLYCRTDNWVNDIGNSNIDGVYTIASDWDWDNYSTFMVGATATVTITYSESTINIKMSFVNGETTHYQNYTFVNSSTESPSVVLFADGCNATFE